ncbi:MAG TPA: hypothetical protein PKA82_08290 [Pyrinomonadaceae bacterium]|nr:hypothetical protein [Pyrinomonadaceae bacterium]
MVKIVIGIIVGFLVWSIVWVGGQAFLESTVSPNWIGQYSREAEKALMNNTPIAHDSMIALIFLVRSFFTSIIAGYMCALIAGEFKRSTLILGIILLAVGLMVQIMAWAVFPVWYHIAFLLLLVPMTVFGGKLRRPS